MKLIHSIYSIISSLLLITIFIFSGCSSAESKKNIYARPEQFGARGEKQTFPFYVYKDFGARGTIHYIPSGYMGDQMAITLIGNHRQAPYSGKSCIRVVYDTSDPGRNRANWAGIYWLTPPNNWGVVKGAGYNLSDASALVFYAKGAKGNERVDFKVGGVQGEYQDSDMSEVLKLRLTKEWKRYEISLSGIDTKHIIGGFCLTLNTTGNPYGAIFYLDEIYFTN